MSSLIHLRVILGGDDARKLSLSEIPESLDKLALEIKNAFGLVQQFRLQYRDADFGNEFVNLSSTSEIKDRDTLKVVFLAYGETTSVDLMTMSAGSSMSNLGTSQSSIDPHSSSSLDERELSSHSVGSADTVILDPVPEARTSSWPSIFKVPKFSLFAEIQLTRANAEFRENGSLLTPAPNLRTDILEGMADEIFKYTAYPSDIQIAEAAEVLVHTHPCLREKGAPSGYEGWKEYLRTKVGNFRTKLRKIDLPEVAVNSLKKKRKGEGKAAANIKKPRKAEVNFLPPIPPSETAESLERERVALLRELKKRHNEAVVKEKMEKTYAYRRQDIILEGTLISEAVKRWPALFTVGEINAEFMRLTTIPLEARFFAELDKNTPNLIKVFKRKGGIVGNEIKLIMAPTAKSDDIEIKRDCVLQALSAYLGEDLSNLVKVFKNIDSEEAEAAIAKMTMGVYVIRKEDEDDDEMPEDVGVVIEGVELLSELRSVTGGLVMLFGLIYAFDLKYPQELKCTFEFFQKVLMNMEGKNLSRKVQALKIKMLQ